MEVYLAVDIGGTKISVCQYDDSYRLLMSRTLDTTEFRIRSLDFVKDVKAIIAEHLTADTTRIGVSWNCFMNDGVVIWSSLLGGFANYPLRSELQKEFRTRVQVDDDIHSMTAAEYRFGKGVGLDHFVLLNLGTGIGAAACENGLIVRGANNLAGIYCFHPLYVVEFGESIAIENLVSGRGIQEIYVRYGGSQKPAREIFERAGVEEAARKTLDLFSKYLAQHLVELTFFYNPKRIVLNGSIKKSGDLFLPQAFSRYREEMKAISTGLRDPRVRQFSAEHGDGWIGGIEELVVSDLDHGACLGVI
jgi:glucokinase